MSRRNFLILNIFFGLFLSACSSAVETPVEVGKTFWGSSTRALEEARTTATIKNFQCDFNECFDEILKLNNPESETLTYVDYEHAGDKPLTLPSMDISSMDNRVETKPRQFYVFIQDQIKKHLVVIDVPGSVDTTEVGIFFVPLSDKNLRLEVSSLSSRAKKTVSDIVFGVLTEKFGEVQDPTIHK